MMGRRAFLALLAGGAVLAGGAGMIHSGFQAAMVRARRRLAATGSKVIETSFGPLEYAEAGEGRPVLMIHGSGGGCDQGLLFAAPLVEAGFRVIAPSRFGYLRSAFPEDPSSDNQADAFAELLDHVGIDRLPVIGGSAGALSALAFAIRHPDRCSALIAVVPAAYAPNRPPARPWTAVEERLAKSALGSDFLFWSLIATSPRTLLDTILATNPALLDTAPPAERRRVLAILDALLPVSERRNGLLNDMRLAGTPAPMPLERISAPTLAISLADDRYLTADAARHIAERVEGAQLIIYPTGGHVWIGHNAELFSAIHGFIEETVP